MITRRCFTKLCALLSPVGHLVENILTVKSPERDTLVIVVDKPTTPDVQAEWREMCRTVPDITIAVLFGVDAYVVGKPQSFYSAGGRRFRVIADGAELKDTVWCDVETGLVCQYQRDEHGRYVISGDRAMMIVRKFDEVMVERL